MDSCCSMCYCEGDGRVSFNDNDEQNDQFNISRSLLFTDDSGHGHGCCLASYLYLCCDLAACLFDPCFSTSLDGPSFQETYFFAYRDRPSFEALPAVPVSKKTTPFCPAFLVPECGPLVQRPVRNCPFPVHLLGTATSFPNRWNHRIRELFVGQLSKRKQALDTKKKHPKARGPTHASIPCEAC